MCDLWHARFMQVCDLMASFSEDPQRQVGAVITGPGHVICATGWNGLPRGVSASDPARFDRDSGEKFHWVEHAERNAIFNAARIGTPLAGTRLYTNVFPCADCARAIVQSGIAEVCTPDAPPADSKLGRSFAVSEQILQEAGVRVIRLESARPQVTI
ncbi:deoxycytidylate deaminase [Pseudooceanicola algae]|uniref:Uncharacterized protein n=1 Tax=Pseudooceanicola algae TaxID=1537215 RepID=A0A418SJ50_9RHOB|nr:deaminase [Pseudooceanicola algae]QPM90146.1 hypothetical protein PSAL_013810 [Pseudooceanicola algae]